MQGEGGRCGGSHSTDPKDIENEVKAVFEDSIGKEEAELVTKGIAQVAAETVNPTAQSTSGSQSTTPTANQSTTQPTTPSTNNTTQSSGSKQSNFTPVNADDDFLRGFNSDYTDERPKFSTPITRASLWDDSRKELSHKGIAETTADSASYKYITGYDPLFDDSSRDTTVRALREKGITPIYDPFLDGFNADDEESHNILPSKRGSPVLEYSGYTGAWEPVQLDTSGSGFQIRTWTEDPQVKTDEELQNAYEKAKSRFDAVSQELERYMRENRDWNTPWYNALSREYGRAWEQYSTLKEQYMAQFPDNRLWGVISGSGMDYAGQMLSAAGTMVEGMAEYFPDYGPYQNEIVGFNPSAYVPERDTTLITEYVSDPLREKGAELSQKGQAMVQNQKKGLGKFGNFAVDLGSAAAQMVLDIGLGVVTGGGMAIPAAIRTFGASATEAAAEGADLNQQMLYATTSAAATYGIEQLCNVAFTGLKSIAPGIADDVITAGVENLAQELARTPKGAEALKNIGMLIASGVGEGVEETLESLLNPFFQRLSYNQNAETVFQNPKLLNSALYDGAIGGILGMFGSGTNTAIDLVDNLVHNKIMPGEKLMAAAGVSEPEVLGAMALNEMAKIDEADSGYFAEDNSSNANLKADILENNRLQGQIYEQQEFLKFSNQYSNAVEQVTIKTASGVRTRVDAIGLDANGEVVIHEFKSSSTAPLTKNQKIAFEEIYHEGGIVVGKGKGIFHGGYRIPAGTKIQIVRP